MAPPISSPHPRLDNLDGGLGGGPPGLSSPGVALSVFCGSPGWLPAVVSAVRSLPRSCPDSMLLPLACGPYLRCPDRAQNFDEDYGDRDDYDERQDYKPCASGARDGARAS